MTPLFWKLLAILFVALAVVGTFLPIVPTVPFLIVAAAAASRGWPWLDDKLTSHPRYGPVIVRWRRHGAIPRSAKGLATLGMVGGYATLWLVEIPTWVRIAVPAAMACVAVWIWTRPEE
ncbi:MAG: YbaN family protein [Caldimonas sp.]